MPPAQPTALMRTDLRLPGARGGKVRDLYDLPPAEPGGPERVLIVASDRISAFDVVLPTPAPEKGRLLTEIAAWWLRWIEDRGICPTHLLSTDAGEIPDEAFEGAATARADLEGRVMIGRRCRVVPIECVVRGYIEGSGWADYERTGAICGVPLPAGLRRCDRLPEPIFTPATKAEEDAHDKNISFDEAADAVGGELMERLRALSLSIYKEATRHSERRGIMLADTKFEFGLVEGSDEPILIDEALTPDSSRFWPANMYAPGSPQLSFDKQYVREHLERLVAAGEWDKTPPGPELPAGVVEGTLARYREARDRLTGA